MHKLLIRELGEKELIKRLSKYMPKKQISDDCAYIKIKNNELLVNTDLMVENTHFEKELLSAFDLGWKATASNFSDLLSSGCENMIGINIGLVLPSDTEWEWVEELYEGINHALNEFGGSILGGDISKGSLKTISINALGTQGKLIMRRYESKPGEILLTTGVHGLSKLGLNLKQNQISNSKNKLSSELISKSINAFCKPFPKKNILNQLIKSRNKNDSFRVGCTDSSDGFYQAVLDLAQESKCKAVIDYKKIPKEAEWPDGDSWDEFLFFGGEDYQLVFSLPEKWAKNLISIDKSVKEFGYLTNGLPSVVFENLPSSKMIKNKSFKHF